MRGLEGRDALIPETHLYQPHIFAHIRWEEGTQYGHLRHSYWLRSYRTWRRGQRRTYIYLSITVLEGGEKGEGRGIDLVTLVNSYWLRSCCTHTRS